MTRQNTCAACHRSVPAGNKYCVHHAQAFQSLTDRYSAWVRAYGRISWQEFMDRLSKMDETGRWVKEVISVERSSSRE